MEDGELEELRKQIIEGCQRMAEVYEEVDRHWNAASDEAWAVAAV
jgi:hypothetical protein